MGPAQPPSAASVLLGIECKACTMLFLSAFAPGMSTMSNFKKYLKLTNPCGKMCERCVSHSSCIFLLFLLDMKM